MEKTKLKDWTAQIEGLAEMEADAVINIYTEMLATAHDIGYKVPDELLIETENPDELRKVIVPLHEGIVKFHAEKPATEKVGNSPAKKSAAKKPAKPAKQKGAKQETEMEATAKKAAKAKTPKKAASDNARVGVGRFTGDEVITVKAKTNPAREGSAKHERVANLMKHHGKTVKTFLGSKLGRSSTLHNAKKAGIITIK
jgi:hypothetical protein